MVSYLIYINHVYKKFNAKIRIETLFLCPNNVSTYRGVNNKCMLTEKFSRQK